MRRSKPETGPTPPAKKPRKQEGEPSLSRLTARQLTVARLVSSYKYECKKVFHQIEESQRQWSMEIDSKKQSHHSMQDPSGALVSGTDRLRRPESRTNQHGSLMTEHGEPWKQSEREILKRCLLAFGLGRWREIEHSVRRLQRTNRHTLLEMESSCWDLVSKLENCLEGKEKEYLKYKLINVSQRMPFQSSGAQWTKYQTSARSWARRLQLLDNIRLLRNQMKYPILKQFFKDSLRLMSDANPPTSWWCPDADLLLISGAYTYGYGSYDELRSDREFFQLFKQSCIELGHTPRALNQQEGGLMTITEWPATDLLTKRLKRVTDNLIKAQQRNKNKVMMVEISYEKLTWTPEQKRELIKALMKFGLPLMGRDSTPELTQSQWMKLLQSPSLESLAVVQGQALCNELLAEMESIVMQRSDDKTVNEDMEAALKMEQEDVSGVEEPNSDVFTIETAVHLRGQLQFLKLLKSEHHHLREAEYLNKLKTQMEHVPEWWICGIHDHELVKAIQSHGFGSWNEILNNHRNYSFWKCKTIYEQHNRTIANYCSFPGSSPNEAVDKLASELAMSFSKEQVTCTEAEAWLRQRTKSIGILFRNYGAVLEDYAALSRTGPQRDVQDLKVPMADRESNESISYPIIVSPLLSILSLGTEEFERTAFHSGKHMYPIGYRSQRRIETRSFICEVIDGDGGTVPIFQIVSENEPSLCLKHESLTELWKMLLSHVPEAKDINSGEELFGFSYPYVMKLINSLPNAKRCCLQGEGPSQSTQRTDQVPHSSSGLIAGRSGARTTPPEAFPDWLSRLSNAVSLTTQHVSRSPHTNTSIPYHGLINRSVVNRPSSQHRGVLLLNPSQGMQSLTNVQQTWRPGGYSWTVRPALSTSAMTTTGGGTHQTPVTIPLSSVHAGMIRPQPRATTPHSLMNQGRAAGNQEGQKWSSVVQVNTSNEGIVPLESEFAGGRGSLPPHCIPMSSVNYPDSFPTSSPHRKSGG
eukprot:g651.t1